MIEILHLHFGFCCIYICVVGQKEFDKEDTLFRYIASKMELFNDIHEGSGGS